MKEALSDQQQSLYPYQNLDGILQQTGNLMEKLAFGHLQSWKPLKNGRNRIAGTPTMKSMDFISRYHYRRMLINLVLPVIKTKWSFISTQAKIQIQQDNTRPHTEPTDYKFLQATFEFNLNVELVFQPPNSPDLNVLDLRYFNSIQSLQYHCDPKNIQELVEVVETSFDALHWSKLNDTFLSLFCVMEITISKCHIFAKENQREEDNSLLALKS